MKFFLLVSLLLVGCASTRTVIQEIPTAENQNQEKYIPTAEKFARMAQFDISNYYLRRAVEHFKRNERWERVVKCLMRLGENHRKLEAYDRAIDCFERALSYARSFPAYRNEELAGHLQKSAYRHMTTGHYDEAIRLYGEALELMTGIHGENHPSVAKIFNALALAFWNKGDGEKAVTHYNRSLSIKLRGFNPDDIDFAGTFAFIDGDADVRPEFRRLRGYVRKSLRIHLETMGRTHPMVASLYENLAILYGLDGAFDHAVETLRKSLDIRLTLFGEESGEVAQSYHNLGVCLRMKDEFADALYYLERALQIKQGIYGHHHPRLADTCFQLGKVHARLNRFERALDFYQHSLISLVPGFSGEDITANPEMDILIPREELLNVLYEKAETLRMRYLHHPERLSDLQMSVTTYRLVAELIGLLRRDFKSGDYKLLFGRRSHAIYAQALQAALTLFDVSADKGYRNEAFLLSENSKAAILRESLFDLKARAFSGIPGALLEDEQRLRKGLAHYRTYLEKATNGSFQSGDRRIASLEEEYYTRKEQYHQLIAFFERNYPDYFRLKYENKRVHIADIQTALPGNTAMLHYFVGRGVLVIFAINRHACKVVMRFTGPDFEKIVRSYYQSIKKIEDRSFVYLSHKLYRLLVEPVTSVLDGKNHLIIIPQSILYYVPFEALTSREFSAEDFSRADYLIKRFSISYHYSAGLWLDRLDIRTDGRDGGFLGFAPVSSARFTGGGSRSKTDSDGPVTSDDSVVIDGQHYPVLRASESEVRSIIDLFRKRGYRAQGFFHHGASESDFKSAVADPFAYVHVATHSLHEIDNPVLAGLIFSPYGNRNDDGILYSEETFNLDLNADLIVLSSCETGIGQLVRGEGMMALSRGFFYSGARNMIFSLWKVGDRATSRLMVELYRHILDGFPFHRALRKAKLTVLMDPLTAFPSYWGGFILVGQ